MYVGTINQALARVAPDASSGADYTVRPFLARGRGVRGYVILSKVSAASLPAPTPLIYSNHALCQRLENVSNVPFQ
jgi:hypothetical protein